MTRPKHPEVILERNLLRAATLLKFLHEPRTFNEIMQHHYLPPATFYRMVRALDRLGWIQVIGKYNKKRGAIYVTAKNGIFPDFPRMCPRCRLILRSEEHEAKHFMIEPECRTRLIAVHLDPVPMQLEGDIRPTP